MARGAGPSPRPLARGGFEPETTFPALQPKNERVRRRDPATSCSTVDEWMRLRNRAGCPHPRGGVVIGIDLGRFRPR